MKLKIKQGDEVVVIAGSHKGKRGKVMKIDGDAERVIVEGVALRKRHVRKSQENPEGAIEEREGSIHYSNIMLASRYDERRAS